MEARICNRSEASLTLAPERNGLAFEKYKIDRMTLALNHDHIVSHSRGSETDLFVPFSEH